jgi:hypothetical protein
LTADDIPRPVYSGSYTEVVFLKSLLEASGVPASILDLGGRGNVQIRLQVRAADVERAWPIVEDFKINGKKTEL